MGACLEEKKRKERSRVNSDKEFGVIAKVGDPRQKLKINKVQRCL